MKLSLRDKTIMRLAYSSLAERVDVMNVGEISSLRTELNAKERLDTGVAAITTVYF